MSQVFIVGSSSSPFPFVDPQVAKTWGNVLEKIAPTEADSIYTLGSCKKPFPKALLNRDQQEVLYRKRGTGSCTSKRILSCHPVPIAF